MCRSCFRSRRLAIVLWLAVGGCGASSTALPDGPSADRLRLDAQLPADEGLAADAPVPEGGADAAPAACQPTAADALGPYFVAGAPWTTSIAAAAEPGQRIQVHGTVRAAADCATPLHDAVLDVWQADAAGKYPSETDGYRLRGKVRAGPDGSYRFETVMPGHYEGRPAHIHLKVMASGYAELVTQLYVKDDPYLYPKDSCGPPTCHSNDPRRILEYRFEDVQGRTVGVAAFDPLLPRAP